MYIIKHNHFSPRSAKLITKYIQFFKKFNKKDGNWYYYMETTRNKRFATKFDSLDKIKEFFELFEIDSDQQKMMEIEKIN